MALLSSYIESISGAINENAILNTNFSNIYKQNLFYIKQPRDMKRFLNSLFEAQFKFHIQQL